MSVIDSFRLDGKVALVSGGTGLYEKQIVEALISQNGAGS
jgi:tRNA A37 N6-isopentenylltransferase MiaA